MRITRPRATKLSQITIDADLDMGAHTLKTDNMAESTADAGVIVDGVECKDNSLYVDDVTIAWEIWRPKYVNSFSIAAQDGHATGLFFNPTGTKMYVIGYDNDNVNEYDLSTPWDVSTAVFLQLFSVAAKEITPEGVFFNPTGTKMYVIGYDSDNVNEYDLSTPWDVTTAVFLQLFSVAAKETEPKGMFFNPTGTKMYVVGKVGNSVYEYDLGTPWDVTTSVYLQAFYFAPKEENINGLFFKPDGTKMYVVGVTDIAVNEYDLSTPWDVTTLHHSRMFLVDGHDATPQGIFFKSDGMKMYVIGYTTDMVFEYDI